MGLLSHNPAVTFPLIQEIPSQTREEGESQYTYFPEENVRWRGGKWKVKKERRKSFLNLDYLEVGKTNLKQEQVLLCCLYFVFPTELSADR